MPTFEYGNMWSAWNQSDLFLITTNSTINMYGRLVMGAGIAREARDRFPGLDKALADEIKKSKSPDYYSLIISPHWPERKLGAFQVKSSWQEDASLFLIDKSTTMLMKFLKRLPGIRVDLNYPGIGNGKLNEIDVFPIIQALPPQVHIWRYKL